MIGEGTACAEERAGAGELLVGPGCLQYIVQFALQAQAIRPAPEVVEVEIETRVLDDADHVVKVRRTAGLELQDHQVFRTDNGEGESVEQDCPCACQRLVFLLV